MLPPPLQRLIARRTEIERRFGHALRRREGDGRAGGGLGGHPGGPGGPGHRAPGRVPGGSDRRHERDGCLRSSGPSGVGRGGSVGPVLRVGHRGAGPGVDEPGRRDGGTLGGSGAAPEVRDQLAAGPLPAPAGDRRDPRHDGPDRAHRRLRSPGHAHNRAARRRQVCRSRLQDLDQQRREGRPDRAPVQNRSRCGSQTPGDERDPGGEGARTADRPGPSEARLQGRRILRGVLRRVSRLPPTRCSEASPAPVSLR